MWLATTQMESVIVYVRKTRVPELWPFFLHVYCIDLHTHRLYFLWCVHLFCGPPSGVIMSADITNDSNGEMSNSKHKGYLIKPAICFLPVSVRNASKLITSSAIKQKLKPPKSTPAIMVLFKFASSVASDWISKGGIWY